MKLIKKIKMEATITVETGLHIGGSKENVEIGGVDRPVIKLGFKGNEPYIPGSSIKGKMRCLLEQVAGASEVGMNAAVNNLFGITEGANAPTNIPSKLIVRDAMLDETSKALLQVCEHLDMPYTESKWENTIKRVEGKAINPRQTERVPAGAVFCGEFILNVWNTDNEEELLALFFQGLNLLRNDYLGGSGSRGYGKVRIDITRQVVLSEENAWNDSSNN